MSSQETKNESQTSSEMNPPPPVDAMNKNGAGIEPVKQHEGAESEVDADTAASKIAFRPSKLSNFTDSLWTQRKTEAAGQKKENNLPDLLKDIERDNNEGKEHNDTVASGNSFGSTTIKAPTGFVFGSKISDRVIVSNKSEPESSSTSSNEQPSADEVPPKVTGGGTNTATGFGQLAAACASTSTEKPATTADVFKKQTTTTSLDQSKSTATVTQVDLKTGEEDDVNILQVSSKLHAFDSTNNKWHEKGQGSLRVNERRAADDGEHKYETRIVMRVHGSLRLILNSKMFAGMVLERQSAKRIQFSATEPDSSRVQIYVLTCSASDCDQLWRVLSDCLEKIKSSTSTAVSSSKVETSESGTGSDDRKRKLSDSGAVADQSTEINDDERSTQAKIPRSETTEVD